MSIDLTKEEIQTLLSDLTDKMQDVLKVSPKQFDADKYEALLTRATALVKAVPQPKRAPEEVTF